MTARRLILQIASLMVVALALLRCLIVIAPQAYFDQDPRLTLLVANGVGPAGSLLLDALTLAAASVVLLTARRVYTLPIVLALVGYVFIAIHGGNDAGNLRVGGAWAAAIATGLAALHFSSDAYLRRAALALCLGLIGALALRGLHQVFVEHERTLDFFRQYREQQLAAQGHAPGSTAAKLFERRIAQAEASGWFGLANVYGSVVAALLPAWLGVLIATVRQWRSKRASLLLPAATTLAVVLAGVSLVLSGSKGAVGAALLGLAVLTALLLLRRRDAVRWRLAPWLGPALIVLVLLIVAVRGLAGERLDPGLELSLLFRWQYLIGAVRIFLSEPLLGVGPDHFKQAYLIFKPALSPEEITSPHSVLFDYLATLGVGGIALAALFIRLGERAGRLFSPAGDEQWSEAGGESSILAAGLLSRDYVPAVLALLVAVVGLRFEASTLAESDLLARLVGAGLFALLAYSAWRTLRCGDASPLLERAVLLGAAAVLLAHTQIEMTATQPGSAALAFLLLGLAAGAAPPVTAATSSDAPHEHPSRAAGGAALLLAALLLLFFGYRPEAQRQALLREAAATLQPAAEIRWDLAELASLPSAEQQERLHRIEFLLKSNDVPHPGRRQPRFVRFVEHTGLAALETQLIPPAVKSLERAAEIRPASPEPQREAVRLLGALSMAYEQLGDRAASLRSLRRAYEAALALRDGYPQEAGHHRLAMTLAGRLAMRSGDDALAAAALAHADDALALDPANLNLTLEAADLAWESQRRERAARLYERALVLNERHRLDPLEQLDETSLERAATRSDNGGS